MDGVIRWRWGRGGVVLVALWGLAWGLAAPALGWGPDGHRVAARLAEMRLDESAKAGVRELLGNATLVDVATWADDVRGERRETAPWHYVDIPLEAGGYEARRDGKAGETVVGAIERFERILADPSASRGERIEALKFLVHFVADLHQPLHAAERNGDRGGNGRLVFFLDQPRAVRLHRVWDTELLRYDMNGATLGVFVGKLNARISPAQLRAWTEGGPAQWAGESHQAAVQHAYAAVPADGPPPKLGTDYVNANTPVVERQLEMAGVRMASMLNRAFAAGGHAPLADAGADVADVGADATPPPPGQPAPSTFTAWIIAGCVLFLVLLLLTLTVNRWMQARRASGSEATRR